MTKRTDNFNSGASYINPWDALGRVGHNVGTAAGSAVSNIAEFAKDTAIETAKSAKRLGQFTLSGSGLVSDPYQTKDGGEAWGQMGLDVLPFLPYGKIAGAAGKGIAKAAGPAVRYLDEVTSYTKPLLPEIKQAASSIEKDVAQVAHQGVDFLSNIRNKAGSKLASAGLAASMFLGNAAGAAETAVVKPLTSAVQTVERSFVPAAENAVKSASTVVRDLPDAAIRGASHVVESGVNAVKSAEKSVSNWAHHLLPNVGVAATEPGATSQNTQQKPTQNNNQNNQQKKQEDTTTTTKEEPAKEEPTKDKGKKPPTWTNDTNSGGGQNTTIPVIR